MQFAGFIGSFMEICPPNIAGGVYPMGKNFSDVSPMQGIGYSLIRNNNLPEKLHPLTVSQQS